MRIGEFIRSKQAAGLPDAEILPLVLQKFPEAKTTLGSIRWYRWKDRSIARPASALRGERNPSADQAMLVDGQPGIAFTILRKEGIEKHPTFNRAEALAVELRHYLNESEAQKELHARHSLGAKSQAIQQLVIGKATALGFESERERLFLGSTVRGLRPDYYCPVGNTGILMEVERGRTTENNMHLRDLWKCHICAQASYLFLVVPKLRQAKKRPTYPFRSVEKALATFFEPSNYINVDAVFLFGY